MADTGAPRYPIIIVTDAGAPPGCVNIHNQATGQTVQSTQADYLAAIRNMNNPGK